MSRKRLTIESSLRGIAGAFVAISVALGVWVHPGFLAFTAFVGLNLLQSAFTGWCPMMWVLAKLGIPACEAPRERARAA